MPERKLVARELAEIFKVMAHPDRIRIIEELGSHEKDVKTLLADLDLPGPRVSQHLALLRAHRIVDERRDGRHHFYSLVQPQLAEWVIHALGFIEVRMSRLNKSTISNVRALWSASSSS